MEGVWKKFEISNFDMPNNVSSMKFAQKSFPGLADIGVPHGDRDGPRTPPICLEVNRKKFHLTNLNIPYNSGPTLRGTIFEKS